MRFDTLSLDVALGTILAHSLATPEGTIKKGRPLTARDIENLRAAGIIDGFCRAFERTMMSRKIARLQDGCAADRGTAT